MVTAGLQRAAAAARASGAPDTMVLSVLQPWSSLLVAGKKLIETRDWPTSYRGRVAIQASLGFDKATWLICQVEPFAAALRDAGFADPDAIPRGAVVGYVTLADCLLMVEGKAGPGQISLSTDPRLSGDEWYFGSYRVGRYAWITGGDRRVLPEPIPMKGSLGLRHCPADIASRLLP